MTTKKAEKAEKSPRVEITVETAVKVGEMLKREVSVDKVSCELQLPEAIIRKIARGLRKAGVDIPSTRKKVADVFKTAAETING